MTAPERPVITIDPAVKFGQPTIRGIPCEVIAERVFAGTPVECEAQDDGLTTDEVLLACWWETHISTGRRDVGSRDLRGAWGEWAEFDALDHLGGHVEGPCPHPPKVAKA